MRKQKFKTMNNSWFTCTEGNTCVVTGHRPFSLVFPSFPVIVITTTATSFSYFRFTTVNLAGPIYGISATLSCWNQNHFLSIDVMWRAGFVISKTVVLPQFCSMPTTTQQQMGIFFHSTKKELQLQMLFFCPFYFLFSFFLNSPFPSISPSKLSLFSPFITRYFPSGIVS